MSRVGFIGLGTMGRPMARNLLKAGHELDFFTRREEVADEFAKLGGRRHRSAAEVGRAAELIIAIVTADAEVTDVALGPEGVVHGAGPGKVFIDMSTVSPATDRAIGARLSAAKMEMLDAPVSGGPWGAEAGTLAIMAGGDAATFARAKPVFEAMGKNIFHLGALGAGQSVKLINQMVGGGIMALVAEGYALGEAAGVDLAALTDVMLVSSANSSVLEARGRKFVLADQYRPGFMTRLMRKDMALAVSLAQQFDVPVPVAAGALAQYTAAQAQGLGDEDFAAVVKVARRAAGIPRKAPGGGGK